MYNYCVFGFFLLSTCSFVQEFVGDPIDGVTLLLELLKTIQQNGTQTKCTPANQRRITLDENACLQCLKYCMRCQDAARKLAISPAGLYTLAACIMSTVNQSRLLTLEVCIPFEIRRINDYIHRIIRQLPCFSLILYAVT